MAADLDSALFPHVECNAVEKRVFADEQAHFARAFEAPENRFRGDRIAYHPGPRADSRIWRQRDVAETGGSERVAHAFTLGSASCGGARVAVTDGGGAREWMARRSAAVARPCCRKAAVKTRNAGIAKHAATTN